MTFIEVVIKIPESDYKFLKEKEKKEPSNLNYIARKILTGTVLPKGHERLIDVKDLKKDLIYMSDFSDAKGVWEEDIDDAETIIEADKEIEE